jgi:hypothetical protein
VELITEGSPADQIAFCEHYRGCGIEVDQGPARIAVVKAEIDVVLEMSDLSALADYAGDIRRAPEARMLAGRKALAILSGSVDQRQKRPRGMSVEYLRACVAGLGSVTWRDPYHHASLLSTRRPPGTPNHQGVPREVPLPRRW